MSTQWTRDNRELVFALIRALSFGGYRTSTMAQLDVAACTELGAPPKASSVQRVFPTKAHVVGIFMALVVRDAVDEARKVVSAEWANRQKHSNQLRSVLAKVKDGKVLSAAEQEALEGALARLDGADRDGLLELALSTAATTILDQLLSYRELLDHFLKDAVLGSSADPRLLEYIRDQFREAFRDLLFDPWPNGQTNPLRGVVDRPVDEDYLLDGLMSLYGGMVVFWLVDRSWGFREADDMAHDVMSLAASFLQQTGRAEPQEASHLRTILRMEKRARQLRLSPMMRVIMSRGRADKLYSTVLDYLYGRWPKAVKQVPYAWPWSKS